MIEGNWGFSIPNTEDSFLHFLALFLETDLIDDIIPVIQQPCNIHFQGVESVDLQFEVGYPVSFFTVPPVGIALHGEGRLDSECKEYWIHLVDDTSYSFPPSVVRQQVTVDIRIQMKTHGLDVVISTSVNNPTVIPDWFISNVVQSIISIKINQVPSFVESGEQWHLRVQNKEERYAPFRDLYYQMSSSSDPRVEATAPP